MPYISRMHLSMTLCSLTLLHFLSLFYSNIPPRSLLLLPQTRLILGAGGSLIRRPLFRLSLRGIALLLWVVWPGIVVAGLSRTLALYCGHGIAGTVLRERRILVGQDAGAESVSKFERHVRRNTGVVLLGTLPIYAVRISVNCHEFHIISNMLRVMGASPF